MSILPNTSATELLLSNINRYNLNPSSIQQNILNILEMGLNGDDILDVTSPFVFAVEAASTAVAAAIAESESVTRQLYPLLAQHQDELYRHMSDKDYIGIFATGARSTINMLLPYKLLETVAVYLDNSTEVKTVIIPRNTQLTFNGINLGIAYPIQINLLAYNVIQVLYDTSIDNPLMPLSTNVLTNTIVEYQNVQYLQIKVPVIQYTNTSNIFVLNNVSSFTQTIPFADSFYYARAFINNGSGKWIEIKTTHTPIVYDITQPTLLLTVDGSNLTVTLPDIYQSLNTAGTSIRLDIYTTQGELDIDLSQVSASSFSATWLDFDTLNPNAGVKPLSNINDIVFFSTDTLIGGSNAATIEELRNRVIYHINSTSAPVRLTDLSINLATYGYVTQKLIDSVTDRVFIASKNLPMRDVDGLLITPLSANMLMSFNINWGLPGGLYQQSLISHQIQRATVMPRTLYRIDNGNVSILSDSELDAIDILPPADLCTLINSGVYMYSPFHYVIDYTRPTTTVRPYYLSAPMIPSRAFVASNTNRNYNINTIAATVSLVGNEYILVLSTSIPTGITGVSCQLTYHDPVSRTSLFLNGTPTILASTATFTFNLTTNFDITQLDEIEILNLSNLLNVESPMFLNIDSQFNIFYLVSGDNTGIETSFDNLYHVTSAMGPVIGATYETIDVQFGKRLPSLYCPARSILAAGQFLTYPSTVHATYLSDVYQSGPLGYLYTTDPVTQTVTFLIAHHAGDPVLDSNGNPVVLHAAGDPILDANGNMIPTPNYMNSILYQVGITMVDAKYRFATSLSTSTYAKNVPGNIIGYLTQELAPVAGLLNERTELYYKPKGEPNVLKVLTGNKTTVDVSGILNIEITYYLTEEGINTPSIISKINVLTRSIISDIISQPTISLSGLITALTTANPIQVVGFNVDSFLPNNIPLVTSVDPGSSFVVGEELVVLPDGTLEVNDLVKINYKQAT